MATMGPKRVSRCLGMALNSSAWDFATQVACGRRRRPGCNRLGCCRCCSVTECIAGSHPRESHRPLPRLIVVGSSGIAVCRKCYTPSVALGSRRSSVADRVSGLAGLGPTHEFAGVVGRNGATLADGGRLACSGVLECPGLLFCLLLRPSWVAEPFALWHWAPLGLCAGSARTGLSTKKKEGPGSARKSCLRDRCGPN